VTYQDSLLTNHSGVDFDDTEYGFKEEEKSPEKVHRPFLYFN
jgi:hypothetical protein